MPSIQHLSTQRRYVSLASKAQAPDTQQPTPPKNSPFQPSDTFKPESEFVLEYDFSTTPMHSTNKALMCLMNNFDVVEKAGVVRKGKERNQESQTFYAYVALNQADIDPASLVLWNSSPSRVLFPTDTAGDNPDDGIGIGAFRFADDPSNNPPSPDTSDEALAIFADQVGDQPDPVDVKATFDIKVSGSFNDPKKGNTNTRVVTIEGKPFAINDPRLG